MRKHDHTRRVAVRHTEKYCYREERFGRQGFLPTAVLEISPKQEEETAEPVLIEACGGAGAGGVALRQQNLTQQQCHEGSPGTARVKAF